MLSDSDGIEIHKKKKRKSVRSDFTDSFDYKSGKS